MFSVQLSACIWSQQHDRASHFPSSQTITQLFLEKRGKKGEWSQFWGLQQLLLFIGHVLSIPFQVPLRENFWEVCSSCVLQNKDWKLFMWEEQVRDMVTCGNWPCQPNYWPPQGKVCQRASSSSYGHAACLSPPLPLSKGRSEEGWEGGSGVGCLCHWDGLRGDVQAERQNKRAGLFWGWLLRVVGAALVSRLSGRGCGDGEGTEATTTTLKQDKQGA